MIAATPMKDAATDKPRHKCLLFAAGRAKQIDAKVGADTSTIDEVKTKVEEFRSRIGRIPGLKDIITVLAVGFVVTAVSHLGADLIVPVIERRAPNLAQFSLTSKFFWIVVIATTGGLVLSFFSRVRELEGVGASTLGSVLLYVLIATIGMKMNILAVFDQPALFLVGSIWMLFHAVTMLLLAWLIKALLSSSLLAVRQMWAAHLLLPSLLLLSIPH